MNINKKKLLIIAYACDPYGFSESAIGWHFVKHLSYKYDVTVLTRSNNVEAITSYLNKSLDHKLKDIKWIYYDLPKKILKLKKKLGIQLYFNIWMIFSYRYYKEFIIREKFSIINHITLGVVWNSSPFYKLNSKFIWGPVGGSDSIPFSFLFKEPINNILSEIFYKIIVQYSIRFSLMNKNCRKKSRASIFRTKQVYNRYSLNCKSDKFYHFGETGYYFNTLPPLPLEYKEIKAISVSRFDYWKGLIYAVKGFEEFLNSGGTGTLRLIGKGKDFNRIQKYITKNKLSDKIFLLGHVSIAELRSHLIQSNVMIYPSFRDGGSFTILEAMSLGLPIIINDLSGPCEMVGYESGCIVSGKSPKIMINEISSSLLELINNPYLGVIKSRLLKQRAIENFTWEKVTNNLIIVVDKVLNENSPSS